MRRSCSLNVVGLFLFVVSTTCWSKGQTIRIEIDGDGLTAPIVITDPDILRQFSIWNGPGVGTRGPDGVPNPPAYLDPNKPAGRFIDWPRDRASNKPSGLQRLEVNFFIGIPTQPNGARPHVVAYEPDPSESRGFIYLPRWRNNHISHGVEGNWFHASDRWNKLIAPIIAQQTDRTSEPLQPRMKNCVAGHGSLEPDGTIKFVLVDKHGKQTSRWRFETSTQRYESVREYIGSVEPGTDFELSCWPPR